MFPHKKTASVTVLSVFRFCRFRKRCGSLQGVVHSRATVSQQAVSKPYLFYLSPSYRASMATLIVAAMSTATWRTTLDMQLVQRSRSALLSERDRFLRSCTGARLKALNFLVLYVAVCDGICFLEIFFLLADFCGKRHFVEVFDLQ